MYYGSLPPVATIAELQWKNNLRDLNKLCKVSKFAHIAPSCTKQRKGRAYDFGYWQERKNVGRFGATATYATIVDREEVNVDELKAQLLDSLFGIDRGLSADSELRAEIIDIIIQLEAKNPTPSPNEELGALDGTWKLVYTANSELTPLLNLGRLPLVTVGDVLQKIDSKKLTVENKVFLSNPFSQTAFSTTATVEIRSPKRLEIAFREGRIAIPQLTQDLEFPNSVNVLGQTVMLTNLKDALEPVNATVKEKIGQLSDIASQVPDLKFGISGKQAQSWLLNTFLDSDMRISRGDGGSVFVLVKAEDD